MIKSNQPRAKLLWQSENSQQELILHPDDVVTVGRGDANTIMLSSARVSRNHARIEWNGNNFTIRDMSSSNGTFVNGQRVEYMPRILYDGDLIMFERVPMHFEEVKPPGYEQDASSLPTVPRVQRGRKTPIPILVIAGGPDAGREIALDEDGATIGRTSQSATWKVRLNDSSVSRPHALIVHEHGQYSITDLGSINGTTVNGALVVKPVTLTDGDNIGVGGTKLIFRLKS